MTKLILNTFSLSQLAQVSTIGLRQTKPQQNTPLLSEYTQYIPIEPSEALFMPISCDTTLPNLPVQFTSSFSSYSEGKSDQNGKTDKTDKTTPHLPFAIPSPIIALKSRYSLLTQGSVLCQLSIYPTLVSLGVVPIYLYLSSLLQSCQSTSQVNDPASRSINDNPHRINNNLPFSSRPLSGSEKPVRKALLMKYVQTNTVTQTMFHIPDNFFVANISFLMKLAWLLKHFFVPKQIDFFSQNCGNNYQINLMNHFWRVFSLQTSTNKPTSDGINLLRSGLNGLKSLLPIKAFTNEFTLSVVQPHQPNMSKPENNHQNNHETNINTILFSEPFQSLNYQHILNFLATNSFSNLSPNSLHPNTQLIPHPHQPMSFFSTPSPHSASMSSEEHPKLLYSITNHIPSSFRGLDLYTLAPLQSNPINSPYEISMNQDSTMGDNDEDEKRLSNQSSHTSTALRLGNAPRDVNTGLLVLSEHNTTSTLFKTDKQTERDNNLWKTSTYIDSSTQNSLLSPQDYTLTPEYLTNISFPHVTQYFSCQLCHGAVSSSNIASFDPIFNRYRSLFGLLQSSSIVVSRGVGIGDEFANDMSGDDNQSEFGNSIVISSVHHIININDLLSPVQTCWICCTRVR
jgi:hypothetical protein